MSTAPGGWWSAPRPRRYSTAPLNVSAIEYDATEPVLAAVRHWLKGSTAEAPAAIRRIDQGVLVVEQHGIADLVVVHAGDFLVLDHRSYRQGRWHAIAAAPFCEAFRLLPHELPIFDDGEAS